MKFATTESTNVEIPAEAVEKFLKANKMWPEGDGWELNSVQWYVWNHRRLSCSLSRTKQIESQK